MGFFVIKLQATSLWKMQSVKKLIPWKFHHFYIDHTAVLQAGPKNVKKGYF